LTTGGLFEQYDREVLSLLVPRLVVFYNGTMDQPDEKILRLSESFPEDADADIEVKVRMLNVNMGRNKELLDTCRPLGEYSWLVDEVRRNNTTKDEEGMSSAIDKAISAMPDNFVIKPFLEAHRAEVKGMLLTEYNEAEQMELFKEDGRKEGVKIGIEKGRAKHLINLVHKKLERGKDPQNIADEVEESLETVNGIIEAIELLGDEDYDDEKVFEAWKLIAEKL
jgi:hypothetical protein